MSDAGLAGGRPRVPKTDHGDLDMSGVDPLRLSEVRRRVAVVKSFVALAGPTDGDRSAHAAGLGLSVNQFLALVRTWREHGRASAISGAGATKGTSRPDSARNLPPMSKTLTQEVIAALGPDTSLVETIRVVRERCAALQINAPSRSTIWNMVMSDRRSRGAGGCDGLVISVCNVKIPVRSDAQVEFPRITLVVDLLNGAILAAAMDGDSALAATIASGIERGAGRDQILVDSDLAAIPDDSTKARISPVKATAARSATARALGRGFGSLDLIYQLSRAIRPAAMLRSRKDDAVEYSDAQRIISEQLTAHNAARGVEAATMSWLS